MTVGDWDFPTSSCTLLLKSHIVKSWSKPPPPPQLPPKHVAWEWHRKGLLKPVANKTFGLTTLSLMETCGRAVAQAASASLEASVVFL